MLVSGLEWTKDKALVYEYFISGRENFISLFTTAKEIKRKVEPLSWNILLWPTGDECVVLICRPLLSVIA